ncbi:hypothetical protein AYK25_05605 [Thermoplasmatales archaeon SM1-50]|nr:MAG: hypothetical protein AYK25_05605 [Thermoplasmatales archaeon SM1-50]
MRKAIIEIEFSNQVKEIVKIDTILSKVESIELIEILKIDFEKGLKVVLSNIYMKGQYTIDDIDLSDIAEIITILKIDGNKYTCLIKGQPPFSKYKGLKDLSKKFDLNIIWTIPSILSNEKMVISVIGTNAELQKFLKAIKLAGNIKKISFQKTNFEWQSVLLCLTEKQREVIIEAKNMGFYSYPRKIDTGKLAQKIGISKSTVIEHLRKAESRIINNVFAGY